MSTLILGRCRGCSSLAIGGGALTGLPVSELGASRSTSVRRGVVGVECEDMDVPGRRRETSEDNGASSSESVADSADSDVSLPAVCVSGRAATLGDARAAGKEDQCAILHIRKNAHYSSTKHSRRAPC